MADFITGVRDAIALLVPILPPNQTLQIIKRGLISDILAWLAAEIPSTIDELINFAPIINRGSN